jgi:hypothetical protein
VYFPKRRSTTTSAVITKPVSSGVAPIIRCIPVLLVKLTALELRQDSSGHKIAAARRLTGTLHPYFFKHLALRRQLKCHEHCTSPESLGNIRPPARTLISLQYHRFTLGTG